MKVLIIEDENLTARRLEGQLRKYDAGIQVLERLPSVAAAVQWLRTHPTPDLLFLDIHLEDDLGFRIFDQVPQLNVPVIFTTAYDEYMVQAFRVNGIDYLLKPINYDELSAALDKYQRLRQHFTPADLPALLRLVAPAPTPEYKDRFLVSVGNKMRSVDTQDVAYFCFEEGATLLVTRQGQRLPVDYSLDRLAQLLSPRQFYRVNRQYLISIAAIDAVHHAGGRLELELQPAARQPVLVSADRATEFKEWLGR